MNERKLRVFYEVATSLNMTQVANRLYISQPAISQTIQELEAGLDVKLFDRIGKRLYLTYEGEIFLAYVRRILNLYDECQAALQETRYLKSGRLRLGASTTIGIYILPEIIGRFIREDREIEVAIAIENTRLIAAMLLENKIDFAFVEGPVNSEEIIVESFCDDELVIITPPDHPWAKAKKIPLRDLAKEKLIMRERGSGTREVFETVLNAYGLAYGIAMELGSTEAIKKAVEAGLGVSCISSRCITREVEAGRLAVVRLRETAVVRQFSLIYHRDKYLSGLFRAFIEFARETVGHI